VRSTSTRVDLEGAELADNTGLSGGSVREACRRHAEVSMAMTPAGPVAARVRDGEEMHRLHDILPLPVALNGETEERETRWKRRDKSKWPDICVVEKIRGSREAT
jgi:hypothetical protein